jgi:anti-sigma-K factor RskA
MDELYSPYVFGVLEPETAAAIEQHIEEQCPYCLAHLRDAAELAAALATTVEPIDPPARLRARVSSSVGAQTSSRRWTLWVAGLSAACAALLVFSLWSGSRMKALGDRIGALQHERDLLRSTVEVRTRTMAEQLAVVQRQRNVLRSTLETLSKPETRTASFGRTEKGPYGRVFLDTEGVVFAGAQFPPLPANRTFELWLMPVAKGSAPRAAGLFRPDTAGNFVHVSPVRLDTSSIAAVAVSVEPREGSTAPTTKPIVVVPLA